MGSTAPQRRTRRADSQRNYDKLFAAAELAFVEQGIDASLEGIARRAGVAVGTLYGHFPNRLALVNALLVDRNDKLFDYGDRLLEHPSAVAALESWILAVVNHAATYSGLAGLLVVGLQDEASELHESCLRMTSIGEVLVAKASGALRTDVTAADVFALINAAAWVREQMSPEQADRLVRITMAGLVREG
jgi:AcrR family transcriptional regulator